MVLYNFYFTELSSNVVFRCRRNSLSSIVGSRMKLKITIFTTIIDLSNAFDSVDRYFVFYKLLINGVDGNFYKSIKSLYTGTISHLRIDSHLLAIFKVTNGVRQEDTIFFYSI